MKDKEKKCFVLMPFKSKYKEIYTEVYKPICRDNNIHCWRIDEITRPGSITKDIIEGILEADIIIADLTSQNPNVFYELGIAHATGNETIMTCQNESKVPFDIWNYRVIFYEHSITGCKKLYQDLDKAIKELLTSSDTSNNPFQDILSKYKQKPKDSIPLSSKIDYSLLSPAIRRYLVANNIIYVSDVYKIDFDGLIKTKNIGKISVARLLNELRKNNLYNNIEYLKRFPWADRLMARLQKVDK